MPKVLRQTSTFGYMPWSRSWTKAFTSRSWWDQRNATLIGLPGHPWYLHPQPCRRSLQQRHIALTPLMPSQQLGRFLRRHAESFANRMGIGNPSVLQLPADGHSQADGLQPIG